MKFPEKEKSFPAKVLLFGEYTVLTGGTAFAIPFSRFFGSWKTDIAGAGPMAFLRYLLELDNVISTKVLKAIEENWVFESNIPIGYGVGSSGALTAASFDAFMDKEKYPDLLSLKGVLAQMESFFHGKSSGIDPLISYSKAGLLFNPGELKVLTDTPHIVRELFLVDSGKPRKSSSYIGLFKDQLVDPKFRQITTELSSLNENIINAVIRNDQPRYRALFKEISRIQYLYFKRFITPEVALLWDAGLSSGGYYLKLCGAGGGGFFLGLNTGSKPVEAIDLIDPI